MRYSDVLLLVVVLLSAYYFDGDVLLKLLM